MTLLSTHAVDVDRWDKAQLSAMASQLSEFRSARRRLKKAVATGGEALDDAFWILVKADPQILPEGRLRPSHIVNRAVAERLLDLPATKRLRDLCIGDEVQAGLSAIELAATLDTIFDRLELERRLAQRLAEIETAMRDLARRMLDAIRSDDDEDLTEFETEMAELAEQFDDALQELHERLDEGLDAVNRVLREAVMDVADQAGDRLARSSAWGIGPGELQRLSPEERLRLAATLNTDRMRSIASLFGRMRSIAFASAAATVEDLHEEVVDLEFGADLGRVVPSELLLLADDSLQADFMARWSEGELLQYSVTGTDTVGRGGIIVCLDSSYSMAGDRELWAKALMLVLLHLARDEGRIIHVIHFGSPNTFHLQSFTGPDAFTPAAIVEAAETFLASGTDYVTPLTQALALLDQEYRETGRTEADVVFVTDGDCWVSEDFTATYHAEMARMGSRTWGVDVSFGGVDPEGPLWRICEGRVITIHDLQSGTDVAHLFAQLT